MRYEFTGEAPEEFPTLSGVLVHEQGRGSAILEPGDTIEVPFAVVHPRLLAQDAETERATDVLLEAGNDEGDLSEAEQRALGLLPPAPVDEPDEAPTTRRRSSTKPKDEEPEQDEESDPSGEQSINDAGEAGTTTEV